MPSYRMRVHKYIPSRLYGFVIDESGTQVFFHLGCFDPKQYDQSVKPCSACAYPECQPLPLPVPPLLGEEVEVHLHDSLPQGEALERAPKAVRVNRLVDPVPLTGVVESFDHARGYGFVKGSDGLSYHLHRSEVLDGRMPFPNQKVAFYAGTRKGKPRACHVRLCLRRF